MGSFFRAKNSSFEYFVVRGSGVPEVGWGEGREVRIIMGVEVMRRAWRVIGS